MSFKLLIAGPALHMEAEHFIGSFVGFTSSPQGDEETGDKGAIKLDRQSVLRQRQEVLTFQYTFEPAEEKFDLPPIAIDEGNKFGRRL